MAHTIIFPLRGDLVWAILINILDMAIYVKYKSGIKKPKTTTVKSRINDDFAGKIWFKKSYWDIDVI